LPADDHDRAGRVVRALLAYGPEEEPGEATAPARANDEEVGIGGSAQEAFGRRALEDLALDWDIRARLARNLCECLVEDPFSLLPEPLDRIREDEGGVDAERSGDYPGVDDTKPRAAKLRLGDRPTKRCLRLGRAVEADHDRVHGATMRLRSPRRIGESADPACGEVRICGVPATRSVALPMLARRAQARIGAMGTIVEVPPRRRWLDPAKLAFETTAEVAPLTGTIGQPRALDAIEFGLEVTTPGYTAAREISRAFESEGYERRRREIIEEVGRRREKLTESLEEFARERSFALEFTPVGIVTVPVVRGQPASGEAFEQLPVQDRRELERRGKEITKHATVVVRRLRQLEKEAAERLQALERETALEDGTIMIATEGVRVAQVNGLAVLDLGDYRFARPSRVTARVSLDRGQIESIERQIELSGPIHSKGVLIVAGYLAGKYGQEWPLSLRATITFEQSYDEVEGDSASSTELYALLSALAGLPLETKIEGFYAACKTRGLTGHQGVVIPCANIRNLMLADEVVEAVERGEFHVWAVSTIDEGIELLTGRPAGELQPDGTYPEGSVNRLVAERLQGFASRLRAFGARGNGAAAPDGRATWIETTKSKEE